MTETDPALSEPAPAKLNLALHVRGKRPDGRHELETIFAFCIDGDIVEAVTSDELSLKVVGPFADKLKGGNLVLTAAEALRAAAGTDQGATLLLTKNLPVASGIGGGSADAAAALRLLTRLWGIDPAHASAVAPGLGADVPACLLSLTARGKGAGDELTLVDDPTIAGTPVLLVNPQIAVPTRDVFANWDGDDSGPILDWRFRRNDLYVSALRVAPEIMNVMKWLDAQRGSDFLQMSGSGATCFALFDDGEARDAAAAACPASWWHLASHLR